MDMNLKEILEGLSGLEELLNMNDDREKEIFVGNISAETIRLFNQFREDMDDAETQLAREIEDTHKALKRKKDELKRRYTQKHKEVWAVAYKELGIEKQDDDKKNYRFKNKDGCVVEVTVEEEKEEKEEKVIDFRKKSD